MGIERERKFLLKDDSWREEAGEPVAYRQGYICSTAERTVRIRIAGDKAFVTMKGAADKDDPASHAEYEYAIPVKDAEEMLDTMCDKDQIQKLRYRIAYAGNVWEIDEFQGQNQGLVVAEVEFADKGQKISLPVWVGQEVTTDVRYTNALLAKDPYISWGKKDTGTKGPASRPPPR